MDLAALEALVGKRLPHGHYRITADKHAKAVAALHAPEYSFDVAHPVYAHLAPHCGMGWGLQEFFDVVGVHMDSGALFGEGDLTYHQPMQVNVDYAIEGHIASIIRKSGTTGTFDLVTLHLELIDKHGELVVTSKETYVFPRKGKDAS